MSNEIRELTIREKLKVVMEVQEYLCLNAEEYRQLLLHVMKSNRARQNTPRNVDEPSAA